VRRRGEALEEEEEEEKKQLCIYTPKSFSIGNGNALMVVYISYICVVEVAARQTLFFFSSSASVQYS
jgi:hypothetical protein